MNTIRRALVPMLTLCLRPALAHAEAGGSEIGEGYIEFAKQALLVAVGVLLGCGATVFIVSLLVGLVCRRLWRWRLHWLWVVGGALALGALTPGAIVACWALKAVH